MADCARKSAGECVSRWSTSLGGLAVVSRSAPPCYLVEWLLLEYRRRKELEAAEWRCWWAHRFLWSKTGCWVVARSLRGGFAFRPLVALVVVLMLLLLGRYSKVRVPGEEARVAGSRYAQSAVELAIQRRAKRKCEEGIRRATSGARSPTPAAIRCCTRSAKVSIITC